LLAPHTCCMHAGRQHGQGWLTPSQRVTPQQRDVRSSTSTTWPRLPPPLPTHTHVTHVTHVTHLLHGHGERHGCDARRGWRQNVSDDHTDVI
jgi:hypothetical protein